MRLRHLGENLSSPYLLDHVANPVDWWQWGDDAFDEARKRGVPIFLSIGYAACHWCHVMAHESFENPGIAQLVNENFVSIKVDREEHPDVDAVYMDAVVAMTGHGGWPMTVFLDHEARPFFAGTYFPPDPRHGMSSFPQVLQAITQAWQQDPHQVAAAGQRIVDALSRRHVPAGKSGPPTIDILDAAVTSLSRDFDDSWGGFGGAPKFPPSMILEFLVRYAALPDGRDQTRALTMAERTLEAMARGGMYDQVGGGFARYSVDERWQVPHFEKMLYDNALLLRVYLHWWRLTGSPLAKRVARETAEFMIRDLLTDEGGFAASLDADSDGSEGKFYVWTPQDVCDAVGEQDEGWTCQLLSITSAGTFEHGTSTAQLLNDPDDDGRWTSVRGRMATWRAQRSHPARDDKIVASWNGLAIAALSEAGMLLGEETWIQAAERAALFIADAHRASGGDVAVVRTSRRGRPGPSAGVLDDYGNLAEGFLVLAQVTGRSAWLDRATELLDYALEHFADGQGGFFDTSDDAHQLIRRPRNPFDNAEPSGWFAVANALITCAALGGDQAYRLQAEGALAVVEVVAETSPRAAGWGLAASCALLAGPVQVAISLADGFDEARAQEKPMQGEANEMVAAAAMACSPGLVFAWGDPKDGLPLLSDRPAIAGKTTAYVCEGFICQSPVTTLAALKSHIASLESTPTRPAKE